MELRVVKRLNENYIPPPVTSRPFGGAGHRLGSPLPGAGGEAGTSMPGSFPVGSSSTSTSNNVPPSTERIGTKFEVDQTKPTTSVQIRLADGTRFVLHP